METYRREVDYKVITICFPDGQTFQGSILPQHITLRDFIEDTISRLERERRIEVIYHEGLFTESSNFKISDSYTRSALNLDMELEYDRFTLDSIQTKKELEIDIESDIFQTSHNSEIEESSPIDSQEMPTIPRREDSKVKFLLSKDEINFLAGIPTRTNISHSISLPNSPLNVSSPVFHNQIQGVNSTFGSLIDAQKFLIDFGLVKLPMYQFDSSLSESTSQLSESSSGESNISSSTSRLQSPDNPVAPSIAANTCISETRTVLQPVNEKTCDREENFTKISPNIPQILRKETYFITDKYLVKFHLTLKHKPNTIYLESWGAQTVGELMYRLQEMVSQNEILTPKGEKFSHNNSINKYDLNYEVADSSYEIIDYEKKVANLNCWDLGNGEKCVDIYLLQTFEISNEERRSQLKIGYLISVGLYQLDLTKSDEIRNARKNLSYMKRKVLLERDPLYYAMPTNVNSDISRINIDNYIRSFKIQKESMTKVLKADVSRVSPDTLLKDLFEKIGLEHEHFKKFALRTFDRPDYLYGEKPFIYFTAIRRFLIKGADLINLILIPKISNLVISDALSEEKTICPEVEQIRVSGTLSNCHHFELTQIPLTKLKNRFRIRICAIENLHTWPPSITSVFLRASLVHGGIHLCNPIVTSKVAIQNTMRWNAWFRFDISVCNLPREARLHFKVFGCDEPNFQREDSREIQSPIGVYLLHAVNFQVIDHNYALKTGVRRLNMWPSVELGNIEKNPDIYHCYGVRGGINLMEEGSISVNPESNKAAVLIFQLDEYSHPILIPTETDGFVDESMVAELDPGAESEMIEQIIARDHFSPMSKSEKELIQKYSYYCCQRPNALPKYLQCINWANAESVHACHYMLKRWCPLTLEVALTLLDCHFADQEVRKLAVHFLERLQNEELQMYLLQLVQVLKIELYHDSPLARFLVDRALRCKIVGHYYFWYIRSEIGTPEHQERYSVLLESFLCGCDSSILENLTSQVKFITNTVDLYKKICFENEGSDIARIKECLRSNISQIQVQDQFCPIYDPLIEVGKIEEKMMKIMVSKKKPIWFEFKNNDPYSSLDHIKVLVKVGDDLRQDMLTLQMFRLMDRLWLENGLDLHLTIYGCLSTGIDEGIIEIVQNAKTVCNIQREAKVNILESFQKDVLLEWLKKKNTKEGQFQKAKENFLFSCAGYCVATYVLGIGDRHSDNIMLGEDGNLFHIDFGHFLGNKKKKYRINREPVPFILTPDFIHVLGGIGSETYNRFLEISIEAYQIIRSHSVLFITLFNMMKATGLPELRGESDIAYLEQSLKRDLTNDEASKHFLSLVQKSIENSLQVQISWHFHLKATNVSTN